MRNNHPVDTEMEEIVVHNLHPLGKEEHRSHHTKDNEVVAVHEDDDDVLAATSYSSFALDYENIVDWEKP